MEKNGWPLINNKEEIHALMENDAENYTVFENAFADTFETVAPRWAWLRNPDMSKYHFGNGLTLEGTDISLDDTASPSFLGVRQTQMELDCLTEITVTGKGTAGLTVYHNNEHHYDLCVSAMDSGLSVFLRRRAADMRMVSECHFFKDTDHILLKICADRNQYVFYAGTSEDEMCWIGTGSTQLLSTEVMKGTFTGCFFGLYAEGKTTAHFPYFKIAESYDQKEKNRADMKREYPV